MSLHMFGMTNATVGRVSKSLGKSENGRFTVSGRLSKLTHGACLRS